MKPTSSGQQLNAGATAEFIETAAQDQVFNCNSARCIDTIDPKHMVLFIFIHHNTSSSGFGIRQTTAEPVQPDLPRGVLYPAYSRGDWIAVEKVVAMD